MEFTKTENAVICKISMSELEEKWGVTIKDVITHTPAAHDLICEIMIKAKNLLGKDDHSEAPMCAEARVVRDMVTIKICEMDIDKFKAQMQESVKAQRIFEESEEEDYDEIQEELPYTEDDVKNLTSAYVFDGFYNLMNACKIINGIGIRSCLFKEAGRYILAVEEKLNRKEQSVLIEYSVSEKKIQDFIYQKEYLDMMISEYAMEKLAV